MPGADRVILQATLPVPVSVNHVHRTSRGGRRYVTRAARTWQDIAVLELRRADFRRLPDGLYWLGVAIILETRPTGPDLDNAIQPVLNALKVALGVDDRYVGMVGAIKALVDDTGVERVQVSCRVLPVDDEAAWSALSRDSCHAI
ncbi:MAG: hypothetical protein JOZ41_07685 [Chloroflexi bacterium]|nr:hypothetical protein [Chloroflexota bacterium]